MTPTQIWNSVRRTKTSLTTRNHLNKLDFINQNIALLLRVFTKWNFSKWPKNYLFRLDILALCIFGAAIWLRHRPRGPQHQLRLLGCHRHPVWPQHPRVHLHQPLLRDRPYGHRVQFTGGSVVADSGPHSSSSQTRNCFWWVWTDSIFIFSCIFEINY